VEICNPFSRGFGWAETHIYLGQEMIPVGQAGERRAPLSLPPLLPLHRHHCASTLLGTPSPSSLSSSPPGSRTRHYRHRISLPHAAAILSRLQDDESLEANATAPGRTTVVPRPGQPPPRPPKEASVDEPVEVASLCDLRRDLQSQNKE
jgi:hypothetical protein